MNPGITQFHTLRTDFFIGICKLDLVEMGALCGHCFLSSQLTLPLVVVPNCRDPIFQEWRWLRRYSGKNQATTHLEIEIFGHRRTSEGIRQAACYSRLLPA